MSDAVDRLVAVVEALRDHCPWTAALTHAELTGYLVEEAYEAVERIEAHDAAAWADVPARRADGSYAELAGELGDVLFQVVLHAAVSRPAGAPPDAAGFRLDDAAEALTAKMIRRNPLVLTPEGDLRTPEELAAVTPEDVELAWERVKQAERAAQATAGGGLDAGVIDAAEDVGDRQARPDAGFGGIPSRLPALAAAAAVVDRAGRQRPDPLVAALGEVLEEARHGGAERGGSGSDPKPWADRQHRGPWSDERAGGPWADEQELGAELFALVRRARTAGLDPERALRGVVGRVRAGEWEALARPRRPA